MATNSENIKVGAGVLSVGDYVTAGGAGTLVDIGHVNSPITLAVSYEDFEVGSERVAAVLDKYPQMMRAKIKAPMTESFTDHIQMAMRQAAANQSGISPDFTLEVGEPTQRYHQVEIVTPGTGTTKTRTWTFWKTIVESIAETPFAKGAEQLYEVVFDCCLDESVVAAGKIFKLVET